MCYVVSILPTVIYPWISKAIRPNENPKNRSFPSQVALCCVSLFRVSTDRPIHFIMHINQLPDKNTLLTSEMCYCICKLLLKGKKIKGRKVACFSTKINTNFKYKWHQKVPKIEKLEDSLTLCTLLMPDSSLLLIN